MDTEIFTQVWNQITKYVISLDWQFIFTFIIIAYGVNNYKVREKLLKATRVRSRTRYRTALIGLVYAIVLYFIRGYDVSRIESLFESLVFAIVFHKLIIETIMNYMVKRVPERIGKHIS